MTDQRFRAVERDQAVGVASEDAVLTARLRAGTLTSHQHGGVVRAAMEQALITWALA